jgi:hypothetical protein
MASSSDTAAAPRHGGRRLRTVLLAAGGAAAGGGAGADLVSFASAFLANPDLPARLAAKGPYNLPDRATYYGGDDRGYLDYPTLTDRPCPGLGQAQPFVPE